MKPSLQLKIGQHLTMTPQLQQAIRLLQLSTLDLQTEIQEALESNPLLDVDDPSGDSDTVNESSKNDASTDSADTQEVVDFSKSTDSTEASSTNSEEGSVDLESKELSNELPVDSDWDTLYDGGSGPALGSGGSDDDYDFEGRNSAPESLYDTLMWQLNLSHMSDMDRMIAMAIIEAINSKGYLSQSIEEIRDGVLAQQDVVGDLIRMQQEELEALGIVLQPDDLDDGEEADDSAITLNEVLAVLHRIHQFDPPGVGARDLRECLLIQLKQLDDEPAKNDAILVVDSYLEALGSRDFTTIMRKGKLSEARLKEAIALIQTLNPHPGADIEPDETQYVIPDVIVSKEKERWKVELNPDATPRLRVNGNYASLIQRADNSSENTFLKNNLQEARWFIKSLQSRNETLLKVATKIVEHQIGFLEHGEEAMKPLVLHDIAEAVSMHESTISRVTTQKFMHTPRGIFELKYFFSSHVSTGSGGECSSTAIRAIIKKLVAAENPKKPLSDSKIANILAEQDIKVARRTIAKYREAMMIPPSNERKRLV